MVSKPQKTCTLIRYIKVFLSHAGDIYVKSLAGSSSNIAYGNTMGCPTPQVSAVRRSFRTVDEELLLHMRRSKTTEQNRRSRPSPAGPTPKIVFGRIDEADDDVVFLDEDHGVGLLRQARPDQVYASTKRTKAKVV